LKKVFVKKFPLLGEEYFLAYKVNKREREVIFLAIGGGDLRALLIRIWIRCFMAIEWNMSE